MKSSKAKISHSLPPKAYENLEFLNSPPARTIRILSEMLEPANRLRRHQIQNTVVFFGSARTLPRVEARRRLLDIEKKIKKQPAFSSRLNDELLQAERILEMSRYYEDAVMLAEKLTRWFNEPRRVKRQFVICSGGGPGIMEAANRGAKNAKGKSIGLNISLPMEQYPNPYQTPEISFEFHYFFIRKFWFFYLAKGLVVFPGGFGTMDEFFELLTLIQTKKTRKYMPVVLYGKEFWEQIINFHKMADWGTIDKQDLKLFHVVDSVSEAFEYLKNELDRHYFNKKHVKGWL